jgi:hypothetical protein
MCYKSAIIIAIQTSIAIMDCILSDVLKDKRGEQKAHEAFN